MIVIITSRRRGGSDRMLSASSGKEDARFASNIDCERHVSNINGRYATWPSDASEQRVAAWPTSCDD